MTYSPDFSSASPASNWVTPPANIPSADYAYPPDAYADASRTPEAVYVPTAPLMQAPAQDVYSPPSPQAMVPSATAGKVSSSDTYTPSFAKSSATEEADDDEEANKPMPFIGNHPTQTLLATGTGAFGGALIGGAAKHIFFSGDNDDAKSASSGKTTTEAKTATGWEFTDVHPDGRTPKKVTNKANGDYYIIAADGAVTRYNSGGTQMLPPTTPTVGFSSSTRADGKQVLSKTYKRKMELYNTTEAYIKHSPEVIEYTRQSTSILPFVQKMPVINSHERFLVHNNGTVLILNEKREIKRLLTGVGSGLGTGNRALAIGTALVDMAKSTKKQPSATELETALNAFDTALDSTAKKKFIARLTDRKLFGKIPVPLDPVTKHNNHSQHLQAEFAGLQKQLVGLVGFNFDTTLASAAASSNGYYPDFNALNAQCQFVPESVAKAKEAAEKAAKEIKWGELALPALAGAGIVGVGVFVADFILQRRKPKATTTEPEGA